MSTLKLGKYRHYKGKYYEVLGVAKHSETQEDFVYYKALYPNKISQTWVRPLSMFTENVVLPDGKSVPRFAFVSST